MQNRASMKRGGDHPKIPYRADGGPREYRDRCAKKRRKNRGRRAKR